MDDEFTTVNVFAGARGTISTEDGKSGVIGEWTVRKASRMGLTSYWEGDLELTGGALFSAGEEVVLDLTDAECKAWSGRAIVHSGGQMMMVKGDGSFRLVVDEAHRKGWVDQFSKSLEDFERKKTTEK